MLDEHEKKRNMNEPNESVVVSKAFQDEQIQTFLSPEAFVRSFFFSEQKIIQNS